MGAPIVLDITRLYSRRGLDFDTGIDRVLRAYFAETGQMPDTHFLIRQGRLYTLVTFEAAGNLIAHPPRKGDIFRLLKAARALGFDGINLPNQCHFLHIGHSHHGANFWRQVAARAARISIFVHDVIPLDHPEFMRGQSNTDFANQFALWQNYATRFMTNSETSKQAIKRHLSRDLPITVQPLAISTTPRCDNDGDTDQFLFLGTIEPRKNHLTILCAWERLYALLGDKCPHLHIVGRRGWENQRVFDWLDSSPLVGKYVFEHGALSDDELRGFFCRCGVHIIPSLVEGYGLPAIEAAQNGRKLLLSDIAAFREIIEPETARFVAPTNVDNWVHAVLHLPKTQARVQQNKYFPSWDRYFERFPIETREGGRIRALNTDAV